METQSIKPVSISPMKYDWKAVKGAAENFLEALKNTCVELVKTFENIVRPLYDNILLNASAENPKWYYYYKNGKTIRTREKYRKLLENKALLLAKMRVGNA